MAKTVKVNKEAEVSDQSVRELKNELCLNKIGIKRFLDIISLSGENQIKEALLDVKKDSISALVKSPTNTIGISASLSGIFNEFGKIGIDDLILFKNALNIQDKENVLLTITDNKINIASVKTKASLLLRNSEYIKNTPKEEDISKYISSVSGNEFIISEEDIDRINKVYNLIKSENINISSNGKTVKFIFNKLDNEIETEIDLKEKIEPFKIIVSSYILAIFNLLGEVTFSTKKNANIVLLSYNKENLKVAYILATLGK